MVFNAIFERFVESSPACVMYRAIMENVFAPAKLDALFRQSAVGQYERELLFSTQVDVVSLVVCRICKSVHAAYVRKRDDITVSIRALYDKLSRVETGTSRALVQHTAAQVRELIDGTKGRRKPLLKGYCTRILDGNHLGATDHRLKVLRGTAAGALPGQALVFLDPERMVIDDIFPCEDGHAQERSLLDQVLPTVKSRHLLLIDRNFCTHLFLFGIMQRKAYFIVRQHGNLPWKSLGRARFVGRCETGRVYEEIVELTNPETGKITHVRRITVKLNKPSRDGDTEIYILTNLPAKKVPAVKVAEMYRNRWTLEQAFNELTTQLRCELNTLAYPKAALFAFSVAVCAYNLLAGVKGALRGLHGEKTMETKVSSYFLTEEISSVYRGMMIAVPPSNWQVFQTMTPTKLVVQLRRWAHMADLANYPKNQRTSKATPPTLPNAKNQHVSTAKLIQEAHERSGKKPKPKATPNLTDP